MNTREQLNQYLLGLEKRLRLLVVSRGLAVVLGVALGVTLALVLITNANAFSDTSMVVARVVLFISLAVAVVLGVVMPLMKLNQRHAAGKAEASYPGFEERLVTYVESKEQSSPMLELLAMDTLEHAPKAPATSVVPQKSIFAFATSAGAAGAVLLWMILAGPGFLGFGAKTLWAGPPKSGVEGGGFYNIIVEPGNKLVRRRSDLAVTARLVGFQAPQVRLMAKYKSSAKWEEATMLPRSGDNAYEFLFPSIPEPVDYYIDAAGVKSKTFKIDVIDLAGVKNIKVTYHYPTWLGLQDVVENPGGDLRAVVGTVAELNVETDRPLKNGMIELEDGSKITLEPAQGNFLIAKVPIQKDGVYHFAATESSESVRLSQDYFIEAKVDAPPSVKITHPGADARVSPIEEMTVKIEASDDFGLQAMDLHYSVNGAPEKVVSLLANKGAANSEGKYTLNLEDFKMIPGDVVSMYATAKDARTKASTDIIFAEAQPFERNFTQSQQGGGGGGGGGGQQQEQDQIAKRERDIISATHKAVNGGPKDRTATAENAEFLSEMQAKLKEQAKSLADRTKARELTDTNDQFEQFTKEMNLASDEMGPASDKLKAQKWEDAIQPEERALTHLQRAMALFRDIQVARGQQGGGGGGGGGSQAARDLANLFDLELDTEKNQYEQAQAGGGGGGDQQQQQIDEALQKLEELAKRQQQLANNNKNSKQQQLTQDRWQQEQLKREEEDLKKQLQQLQQQQQQQGQLSRNQQGKQSQGQQSQGQQAQGQSQSPGQQGQSASAQQIQRMLQQLQQAQENQTAAQNAMAQGNQSQAQAAQERAAQQLKEAGDIGKQLQRQDTNAQLGNLQNRADQIAQQQKDYEQRLKAANPGADSQNNGRFGAQPRMSKEQAEAMAAEEDKLREQLKKLEDDITKQARDLRASQPEASSKLRDGLSEIQQNSVEQRMEMSSEYIRGGGAAQVVQSGWQGPVTSSLDNLRQRVAQAQQALKDGNQQGAAQDGRQQQLNNIEQMRAQIQQLQRQQGGNQPGQQKGDGKQGGQQPGQQKGDGKGGGQQPGQQQGRGGQQPGGQQPGGNQQANNNGGGNAGNYNGGPYGANYNGGRIDDGRYPAQGNYDPRGFIDNRTLDPNQVVRDAQRQLNEVRQYFKNDQEVSRQIDQVAQELQRINTGDTASALLGERLGRTVLPQLETLELQVRREVEQQAAGGQVRSGGSDKMPTGYADQVYEYFRNLNKTAGK